MGIPLNSFNANICEPSSVMMYCLPNQIRILHNNLISIQTIIMVI